LDQPLNQELFSASVKNDQPEMNDLNNEGQYIAKKGKFQKYFPHANWNFLFEFLSPPDGVYAIQTSSLKIHITWGCQKYK
jgi:hypothetical protein